MATYRQKNVTSYYKEEVTYNTDPTVGAADAYITRTPNQFKINVEHALRDQDNDRTISVKTVQKGREDADFTHEGAYIPAGAVTPTAPDTGPMYKHHFGAEATNGAHGSTAVGTTASALTLTAGDTVAMGLVVGQLLGVVVDTIGGTYGIEVRQIRALPGAEVVTLDRALSANPGTGKVVLGGHQNKMGTTIYSGHGYRYVDGNNHRVRCGGINPANYELTAEWTGRATEIMEKFSGPAAQVQSFTTTIPTPTLAGVPLVTSQGKVWFGATKGCVTSVKLASNNGVVRRDNESCGAYPTGLKRPGKFEVTLEISYILDAQTHFTDQSSLTSYDVLVQLGDQQGKIIAFCTRNFVPTVEQGETDGEVSNTLSGRCLATVDLDEIYLAHL
jgi:hypothetical protein